MLALRDIGFGRVPLNHEFDAGTITVVLGRNHSGKTRLCRLVAGLDRPTQGRIELDGVDVTAAPPGARSVALVYQAFVNYPNLNVFENLASPLRAQKRRAVEIAARVQDIAARLQLDALLTRLPAQLSGGQQQRLAIGRALAKSARVLLLDEPLVNLDYKLREALELELRGMLHAEGLTVIYTTSDPRDAFNLGDQVMLLEDHAVLQSGVPLEVYERPLSAAAADLMSDPGVNRFREHGRLWVVRPEQLTLEPPPGAPRCFTLDVLSVETNGAETYLHGMMGDSHWVARLKGLHRVESGQRVTVHIPREAVLGFAGAEDG